MNAKETLTLLKTFWSSEIIAEKLYGFLAANYDGTDQKRDILAIGAMEQNHADAWGKIAKDLHGTPSPISLVIRFKIVLLRLLSLILPLTIFIHYLEHDEKKAILDYAGLLEIYKHQEETRAIIANIIMEEIGHQ
jgi:rubrerythrin